MPVSVRNIAHKGGDRDYKTQDISGIREERGIVIGVVKVNSHPARMGNLSVFIPQFGNTGTVEGKRLEDDPSQWRQVRYCTPFYSRTDTYNRMTNEIGVKNTAGFIYPCPDIGTRVLCFFPEGRNAEGFWFACAPDTYMMQSLPESSATSNFDGTGNRYEKVPAGEFNDFVEDTTLLKNFLRPKRALNEKMLNQLKRQGIDQDEIRGLSNSGYMRETPSEIIGIVTKGRKIDKSGTDISERSDILNALKEGNDLNVEQQDVLINPVARRKGHVFVMDDGDIEGNSNLMRLRTANGNQILLHDTEDLIYIGNSSGNVWIQMDKDGQIDIYSSTNVNIRSPNINFHADDSIRFHAGNTIQMTAEQNMHIEGNSMINMYSEQGSAYMYGGRGIQIKSDGPINMQANENMDLKAQNVINANARKIALQGPAGNAEKLNKADVIELSDTEIMGDVWVQNRKLKTTVDRVPTHEPYVGHSVTSQSSIYQSNFDSDEVSFPQNPPRIGDTGIEHVETLPNNERIDEVSVVRQPELGMNVGNLNSDTVRVMAAGATEKLGTDFDYSAIDAETHAVGKFSSNVENLKKLGYVKSEIRFNGQLSDPRAWTGKNGIDSLSSFFDNEYEQENIFVMSLRENYQELARNGGIKETDDAITISGMLMAAYTTNSDVAVKFRQGMLLDPLPISGTVSIDTTGDVTSRLVQFYQTGRSAVIISDA